MVGTELSWMPGVTAVVLRAGADGWTEVLLVRRSDNGAWTRSPASSTGARTRTSPRVREVEEEACVVAEVERLVWVSASCVVTMSTATSGIPRPHLPVPLGFGRARPGDDESTDARCFPLEPCPEWPNGTTQRITVDFSLPPVGRPDPAGRRTRSGARSKARRPRFERAIWLALGRAVALIRVGDDGA